MYSVSIQSEEMICVPPERLREAGLSARKVAYIQGLAERRWKK